MGIETAGFSLMAGCMVEVHPIQNSISGKLNRKVEADNGNPYSTVYADGIELANNQNSNNWWFHPGQLSFGGWADLGETSNCQVAEFLIFQGLKPADDGSSHY
jgi:hypothetical protein